MKTRYYTQIFFDEEPRMKTLTLETHRIDNVQMGESIIVATGATARINGIKFDPVEEVKTVFCESVITSNTTEATKRSAVTEALRKGWMDNPFGRAKDTSVKPTGEPRAEDL